MSYYCSEHGLVDASEVGTVQNITTRVYRDMHRDCGRQVRYCDHNQWMAEYRDILEGIIIDQAEISTKEASQLLWRFLLLQNKLYVAIEKISLLETRIGNTTIMLQVWLREHRFVRQRDLTGTKRKRRIAGILKALEPREKNDHNEGV